MKSRIGFYFLCCLLGTVVGMTSCVEDNTTVIEKPQVTPTPDPTPDDPKTDETTPELPEIPQISYSEIISGAHKITGQDQIWHVGVQIDMYKPLNGNKVTAKDLTLCIDNQKIDTQLWSDTINFTLDMKNYGVGDHVMTFSTVLSCQGYKDTEYTFSDYDFYVFKEAPKQGIVLSLVSNDIYKEFEDVINGQHIYHAIGSHGMHSTSNADGTIDWNIEYAYEKYEDVIKGTYVPIILHAPEKNDTINVHATLAIDPDKTNYDAEIDDVLVYWGTKQSTPSMEYSFPYCEMNDINFIYVRYHVKGNKDGKEFSMDRYFDEAFYLKKQPLAEWANP